MSSDKPSVRKQIEATFKEDFAAIPALAGLRVIATERNLDTPERDTALIRQRSLRRLPEAPLTHNRVGMLLTIISAREDFDRAGDDLDELVPAVLAYLDKKFPSDDEASSVMYDDRLAYDIPFTVFATKE